MSSKDLPDKLKMTQVHLFSKAVPVIILIYFKLYLIMTLLILLTPFGRNNIVCGHKGNESRKPEGSKRTHDCYCSLNVMYQIHTKNF